MSERHGGHGDSDDPDDDGLVVFDAGEPDVEDFGAELEVLPRVLAVLPLHEAVVFPGQPFPMRLCDESERAMLTHVLEQDRALALSLADPGDVELGARELGVVAVVTRVAAPEDGEQAVVVTGAYRCRLIEVIERRPFLVARVVPVLDRGRDEALRAAALALRERAIRLVFLQDEADAEELIRRLCAHTRPAPLADFLAAHLVDDLGLQQELLETADVGRRLGRLDGLVTAALEALSAEKA